MDGPAPLRGAEPPKPSGVALAAGPADQAVAKQVRDGVWKAVTALSDAGYAVDELEPPSIEEAAQTALVMLTADLWAGWELMAPYPPRIKGVLSAMIEVAGYPDQMGPCWPT